MNILDFPEEVLNKILNHYVRSIIYTDWANRQVVDQEPWAMFCEACELLYLLP